MKFVIFIILLTNFALAREAPKSLKQRMQIFSSNMERLLPIAFSKKKLSAKEVKILQQGTKEMVKELSELDGHFSFQDNRIPFIGRLLKEHVSELSQSLMSDSGDYSKSMIRSIPKLCIQCHIQDRVELIGINKLKESNFSSKLEFASYQEMLRNFAGASKSLDSVLWNKSESFDVKNQALDMQLALHIRIFDSPKKALKKFSTYASLLKDKRLKQRLNLLVSELKQHSDHDVFSYMKLNDKNITKYASEFEKSLENPDSVLMNDSDQVKSLIFLTNLYDYINKDQKNKNVPVGLYWIANLERKLQQSIFYSLSDLYYKKCITNFSKHPYAKKCFKKYKSDTEEGFTGTRGIDLPTSLKKELEELGKLVK